MFLTFDPLNHCYQRHDSKEEATKWAISANQADSDHPAYELWDLTEPVGKYVGCLWREFGCDFKPSNCWKV